MEKLKTEPTRRIDELFQECFDEWGRAIDGCQELEKEFARRRRALMFARMGAGSTVNRQGQATGANTGINIIFA